MKNIRKALLLVSCFLMGSLWLSAGGPSVTIETFTDSDCEMGIEHEDQRRGSRAEIAFVRHIENNDLVGLRRFFDDLPLGFDVNKKLAGGKRPLFTACARGNEEMARFLLDQGADSALAASNGNTPATVASVNGHVGVINALHEHGADLSAADNEGNTPLMAAIYGSKAVAFRTLVDLGADVLAKKKENTLLDEAIYCCEPEIVDCILEKVAQLPGGEQIQDLLNEKNEKGRTPLVEAYIPTKLATKNPSEFIKKRRKIRQALFIAGAAPKSLVEYQHPKVGFTVAHYIVRYGGLKDWKLVRKFIPERESRQKLILRVGGQETALECALRKNFSLAIAMMLDLERNEKNEEIVAKVLEVFGKKNDSEKELLIKDLESAGIDVSLFSHSVDEEYYLSGSVEPSADIDMHETFDDQVRYDDGSKRIKNSSGNKKDSSRLKAARFVIPLAVAAPVVWRNVMTEHTKKKIREKILPGKFKDWFETKSEKAPRK